ncbi:MAG TPA: glycosyltransferase family 4 protein [Candidatus Saccharimonadales bacterium]|nr:glycosyltransferase family 4 protein [Candidatus Saccharimonadales bacterium]
MKIGFVLDDSLDKADGVQQYILTLGRWFTQHGHEVHYLVGQTARRDIKHVHSLSRNLQVHFNQNRMSTPLPADKNQIKKLLEQERFDVLHVQLPYSPLMAGRVIRAVSPQTAVVGTFHVIPFSKLESRATRLLRLWLWRNIKRFDAVVSVSLPAQKFARTKFKVKSQILPNPVQISAFNGGKRLKKYSDGKLNIVFLGRLVERKGCLHLLKALQLLHDQNSLLNVRVIICGKGPLEQTLKNYVKEHRLAKIVQFVGFVSEDDKPDYLASADLAVFPSLGGESFGIVLIEAMAARSKIVIAGNNPGYHSILHDRPKQLVDPTNTLQFAKTLKQFLYTNSLRRQSEIWQANEVKRYDVAVVGGQLLKLYQELVAKRTNNSHNKSDVDQK